MKIGVFGGTFNPIHIGHAIIASYIAQNSELDAVWLMVSPQNPLKNVNNGATDEDRLKMVKCVADKLDNVQISDFEFSLPRPSYTYSTLNELKKSYPDDEFTLIIGSDNWCKFDKWKNFREIMDNHNILIYPRKGCAVNIPREYSNNIKLIDAPIIELSSTQIRENLKERKNMSFYLSDEVYEYILENNLYI